MWPAGVVIIEEGIRYSAGFCLLIEPFFYFSETIACAISRLSFPSAMLMAAT